MNDDVINMEGEFCFTEDGRLLHENKYLKERVTNLEVFKKNFFTLHMELIEAKEKIALYEHQIQLEEIKERITGLPESFEESVNQGDDLNDEILLFFQESFKANQYRDVIASLFNSIEGLGLDVTVKVSTDRENMVHSLDASHQKYALKIMGNLQVQDDVVNGDDYVVFNLKYISLFAKNITFSDEVRSNQIIKFLKIICSGANTRIESLSASFELDVLHKNIYKVFSKTHASFESMRDNFDDHIMAVSDLYLTFEKNISEHLNKMNLSKGHMKLVKLILYDVRTELNMLLTSGMTIDESFLKTIIKLENAYSSKYSDKI